MGNHWLYEKFDQIGAELVITKSKWRTEGFALDVVAGKDGKEVFQLRERQGWWRGLDYRVPHVDQRGKHLLFSVNGNRFLCGRDEQHWFVAAVPSQPHSQSVAQAMEALKPQVVLDAQEAQGLTPAERMQRRNAAYIRQGEWFFVPQPRMEYDPDAVFTNEPLSRGNRSKPHMVDQIVRFGGEKVYVSSVAPAGLTGPELSEWSRNNPHRRVSWTERVRDATVYARGKVRHPDHETIELDEWHEVAMNRENEAPAMRHVVFLD